MKSLSDKIALVTGASSGIGSAIALALAENGAHVALAARREAALEVVADAVRRHGRRALVVPTDLTQQAQAEHLLRTTLAEFRRLDIIVANAGIYVRGPIETLTAGDFERCMAVNFFGTVYPVLAALPHLRAQGGGHIVLVSSVGGKKAIRTDSPYAASKFAVAGFGDALRQDLYGTGVDVSIIFPGRVATPMIEKMKIPAISAPISAEAVAAVVVKSIRRRHAEVVLPFSTRLLLLADRLSPRLGDWAIRTFRLQGLED